MAKVWIELALSDLNSAEQLYKLRHYRNSFFLFQQATEKATKAFGLKKGILTSAKDLKALEHNPIKFFRRIVAKQKAELEISLTSQDVNTPKVQKNITS